MRIGVVLAGLAVLMLAVGSAVFAETPAAEKGKPQTMCPVMGAKINKKIFEDYEGKRVYFCCPACPPEFKKDPAKYIKKLEDQGVVLEKAPQPKKAE